MSEVLTVEVMPLKAYEQEHFDYERFISDPAAREWAESAAGFITFGLGQAVLKVLEAGNLLMEAKQRLPHGEYLLWVQQACKLKESHARKLVQAASWANREHAPGLDQVTDTTTLFLLSADTTPEDVREWFMERCAAGEVPSRKEVQERKRSAGQPRQPQPAEDLALSLIRKGQLDQIREALALAERAQVVSAHQVMEEQRLRDLGKQRFIAGSEADFHRMKDGSWIRMPHSGRIDLPAVADPDPVPPVFVKTETDAAPTFDLNVGLMSIERAAEILGMPKHGLSCRLVPTAVEKRGVFTKNGYSVTRASKGMVRLLKL